jgi:hypothetical protein
MCTVSFYKKEEQVIITSNRDESSDRPLAIAPQAQLYKGRKLFFPKDPKAGGTWFVVNNYGATFVVLNGAKEKHNSQPPYKKSRGIIVLELASAIDCEKAWSNIDLNRIEPFTLVVYKDNKLLQFRWDEKNKETLCLNTMQPHIWSSATLYEPNVIKQREAWFTEFISGSSHSITSDNIIHFHTHTQIDDIENGILINRGEKMLTKNVTQLVLDEKQFTLLHMDLITKTKCILNEKIANETLVV